MFEGVCDGAASLVIASEAACNKHKLQPIARLIGYSTVGVDPTIMGAFSIYLYHYIFLSLFIYRIYIFIYITIYIFFIFTFIFNDRQTWKKFTVIIRKKVLLSF